MIGKFIGLKSKNYAFTYENELLNEKEKEKLIRCKGTTKATIKNEIHFDFLVNMIEKYFGLKSKNYAFTYVKEYEQFLNDGDKSKLVRCKGTTETTIRD